jgi:hypothetical protein
MLAILLQAALIATSALRMTRCAQLVVGQEDKLSHN